MVPNLTWPDFNRSLHDYPDTRLLVELEHLQPPVNIIATYNLIDDSFIMAIIREDIQPSENGILGLCGSFSTNPQSTGIFYAEKVNR